MSDTYTGWMRLPGSPWQSVVTAATEAAAWQLLRVYVDRIGARLIDLYVGPAGADPGRPRRRDPDPSQQEIFR